MHVFKPHYIPFLFYERTGLEMRENGKANNTLKFVPVQKRKKSGYSVFKSTFLSGEKGKCLL